jgi:hypothetical protein
MKGDFRVFHAHAVPRLSIVAMALVLLVNDQQYSALLEVNDRGEEPGDRLGRYIRRRRLSPVEPANNKFNVSASLQGFNTVIRAIELRLGMAPTVNFTRALSGRSPWKAERAFDLAGVGQGVHHHHRRRAGRVRPLVILPRENGGPPFVRATASAHSKALHSPYSQLQLQLRSQRSNDKQIRWRKLSIYLGYLG